MSEIKVDTLTGKTTSNDITVTVGATATQSLEQGLAKAWVNFNGTGTIATRDSLNVSGLVDGGGGIYAYNITNAFGNTNVSCQGTSHAVALAWMFSPQTFADTTSQVRFYVVTSSGGAGDASQCDGLTNGDLA